MSLPVGIITDSLGMSAPSRGTSWCDQLRERYPGAVGPPDGDWRRTTRFLRDFRFAEDRDAIVIQVGICDCAPRCVPYLDTDSASVRGFLSGLGFEVAEVPDDSLREWVGRRRREILVRIDQEGPSCRSWVESTESRQNVATFVRNSEGRVRRILYILPIEPLQEDLQLYHYKADELIARFNRALLRVRDPRLEFLDLNRTEAFVREKSRFMLAYDYQNEDGYHLSQAGQDFLLERVEDALGDELGRSATAPPA